MARERRDHHVESVLRASPVRLGVRQRADDLELLNDRAGPPVHDYDRQRAVMFGAHVDEADVDAIDLGDELRQGVQLRLHLAPVVVGCPMSRRSTHPVKSNVPPG
jgi:hypothetical protein